jgi:uncharacterized protein YkwD
LHSFCTTAAERAAYDLHARIERFNAAAAAELPDEERRMLEVTNAYRRMFGHRPLAVNTKVCAAARSHSEEMSRLGYFSHFSPTPGRRTPFDRMQLMGYAQGASENCAINPSADGAFAAWLTSSGHHRNLLLPLHTEIGIGNAGRYWTQNFGRGEEFAAAPAFLATEPAK